MSSFESYTGANPELNPDQPRDRKHVDREAIQRLLGRYRRGELKDEGEIEKAKAELAKALEPVDGTESK